MSVRFGALLVSNVRLQKPETITTKVVETSSLSGEKVENKQQKKPFLLNLSITPENRGDYTYTAIEGLRQKDKPTSPVELSLTTSDDGKLKLSSKYNYTEKYTAYETHRYNERYIHAGEEVAPYCRAAESHWEYDTREVPVQRERTERAENKKLVDNQETFNEVYRLMFDLSTKDPKIQEALKFVEASGKTFLKKAKQSLKQEMQAKRRALREQMAALTKEMRGKIDRLKGKP